VSDSNPFVADVTAVGGREGIQLNRALAGRLVRAGPFNPDRTPFSPVPSGLIDPRFTTERTYMFYPELNGPAQTCRPAWARSARGSSVVCGIGRIRD